MRKKRLANEHYRRFLFSSRPSSAVGTVLAIIMKCLQKLRKHKSLQPRNYKFLNKLMGYFHSRLDGTNDRKWRNALQNTRLLSYCNQQRRCWYLVAVMVVRNIPSARWHWMPSKRKREKNCVSKKTHLFILIFAWIIPYVMWFKRLSTINIFWTKFTPCAFQGF